MAKYRSYGTRRRTAGRRIMWLIVLIVVLTAAWYFWAHRRPSEPAASLPEITMPVTAEPCVPVASPAPPVEVITAPEVPAAPSPAPESAPAAPSANTVSLYDQGLTAFDAGQMFGATELLSAAVAGGLDPVRDTIARAKCNAAADAWLFSRKIYDGQSVSSRYKVQSGDLLVNLGKRFKVPYELLMRINGISNARSLAAGATIKVIEGPFHVVVESSKFRLSVYLGDLLVRTYPVGLGAVGRDTPTGLWQVRVKQVNPKWPDQEAGKVYYPDDPDNPLGERWIGLEALEGAAVGRTGFGIHGTIAPEEIGTRASRGCIRLHNKDVEELYDMLTSNVSQVRVLD